MALKIFISGKVGKIVSEDHYNQIYNDFELREKYLKQFDSDYKIVNPMKLCKPSWSWLHCMVVCIWNLLFCDAVYMMYGWQTSRGSRIEHNVAKILNKYVLYWEHSPNAIQEISKNDKE